MKDGKLSTEPYKGVRDFYPEDMAIQSHIFETWAKVAESFGFERYDASVLEPAELYKSKGAENEELVNEQTYTFTDRGEREVTLRPEMTPTVARMIAGKRRDLSLPVRWYSMPNLFRYERTQRGRVREHWQLNADIFGSNDTAADVEVVLLASEILKAFGAEDKDFEIVFNGRKVIPDFIKALLRDQGTNATDVEISGFIHLLDRKNKISSEEFNERCTEIFGPERTRIVMATYFTSAGDNILKNLDSFKEVVSFGKQLKSLGVNNIRHDSNLARGFDYYTGTIFEIFDTHEDNRRSLLGGGRYDNLTALFGGDPIPAVGFGMGDVTMRDFLETHDLLPKNLRSTDLAVIPLNPENALDAEKIAQEFRDAGVRVYVSLAHKKVGEHISIASDRNARFIMVVGGDELASGVLKLKELASGTEASGSLQELVEKIRA